jgi:hypothetical protein
MSEPINSREALQKRISERLTKLGEADLLRLDAISEYAEATSRPMPLPIGGGTDMPASRGLSRRDFIVGLGAGGVAVVGTALCVNTVNTALNDPKNLEFLKMKALLALYEQLEKVGLDSVVSAGMTTIGAALDATKLVSNLVSVGIKSVNDALGNLERSFPLIRQGIAAVEGLVTGLANLVREIQQRLTELTGITRPITDALGKFFNDLLDKIPFGVGANVKVLINNLNSLVSSVPTFIENLNTQLITPLRTDWFADDDKKGLKGNFIEPLRVKLLQPTDNMLKQLAALSDEWQKATSPMRTALAQREEIRKQIATTQATP